MDSIPIVAITGQVATSSIGKDAFQECDIMGVSTPVTKYLSSRSAPAQIPEMVKKAFYISASGRPGPVLIDIPKDIQTCEAEMVFPEQVRLARLQSHRSARSYQDRKGGGRSTCIKDLWFLAGGGVAIPGGFAELQALAEASMCPVATTFKGKGVFNETHALAIGPIGMHGHLEANRLIQEADVLLAVGTRFSDRSTGKVSEFVPKTTIIHVDIDPSEINKNKKVHRES